MENLKLVIAAIKEEKGEFSGENLGRVVEAIYSDNGGKKLTNEQCVDLTTGSGALAGIVGVAQLRGKAVSSDYYQKKTPEQKAGEHGTSQTRKAGVVAAIEITLSAKKGDFESLGKGKKPELEKLHETLISLSDSHAAEVKSLRDEIAALKA